MIAAGAKAGMKKWKVVGNQTQAGSLAWAANTLTTDQTTRMSVITGLDYWNIGLDGWALTITLLWSVLWRLYTLVNQPASKQSHMSQASLILKFLLSFSVASQLAPEWKKQKDQLFGGKKPLPMFWLNAPVLMTTGAFSWNFSEVFSKQVSNRYPSFCIMSMGMKLSHTTFAFLVLELWFCIWLLNILKEFWQDHRAEGPNAAFYADVTP